MKIVLQLKISLLFLAIGYSIPSMPRKIDHVSVEVIAYNAETKISTIVRPSDQDHLCHHEGEIEIVLIKDLSIDEHGVPCRNKTNEIGHIFLRPEMISGVKIHFMDRLEVRPEYRQQGYGTQLFYAAVEYCKEQGSSRMSWIAGSHKAYDSSEKILTQQDLTAFYKRRGSETSNNCGFWIDFPLKK